MSKKNHKIDQELLDLREKEAWKIWNREYRPPEYTTEQILTWLDGMRELMFEVWRNNPSLQRQYEELNR